MPLKNGVPQKKKPCQGRKLSQTTVIVTDLHMRRTYKGSTPLITQFRSAGNKQADVVHFYDNVMTFIQARFS